MTSQCHFYLLLRCLDVSHNCVVLLRIMGTMTVTMAATVDTTMHMAQTGIFTGT